MATYKWPPETRRRAHQLHADGANYKQISRILGVPHGTVIRWLDPEYAERQRQRSRAYKEKHRGTCQDCGKPIWMGSKRCHDCAAATNVKWPRERVIHAIQQWAQTHGRPPLAQEWTRSTKDHPAASAVLYRGKGPHRGFDKWADAIEAAGYPRPYVGHKVTSHVKERQQIQQLQKRGLTLKQIGQQLGMPPSLVERYATTPARTKGLKRKRRNRPDPKQLKKRTRQQRIADLQKALAKEHNADP